MATTNSVPYTFVLRFSYPPEEASDERDRRKAFWVASGLWSDAADERLSKFEANFADGVARRLRQALIGYADEQLRSLEGFPTSEREHLLDRLVREAFRGRGSDVRSDTRAIDPSVAAVLIAAVTQRTSRQVPQRYLEVAAARLAAASSIVIKARVAGYSSLSLAVAVDSLAKLATVFDGNWETCAMFMEAFVPPDVLPRTPENTTDLARDPPKGWPAPDATKGTSDGSGAVPPQGQEQTAEERRRHFYWKVANYSLIFPVLLMLGVMVLAYRHLGSGEERLQKSAESLASERAAVMAERSADLKYYQELAKSLLGRGERATAEQRSVRAPSGGPEKAPSR